MYTLTLTLAERKAIDWIGHRYRHGTELYRLLWAQSEQEGEDDWDADADITFHVPESVAWTVAEIIDEGLDCFASDLVVKLWEFRDRIV